MLTTSYEDDSYRIDDYLTAKAQIEGLERFTGSQIDVGILSLHVLEHLRYLNDKLSWVNSAFHHID